MVNGFATQSGGTLILDSRLGQGTKAEIWLPGIACLESKSTDKESTLAVQGFAGQSALAIDDDELVLDGTVAMLEDLGFEVARARSAREALEILARQSFDVILTDHAMPNITGAQLVEQVLAIKPDQPILLCSGYAELPASSRVITRLAKPFTMADLSEAIRRLLTNPGERRT